MSVASRLVKRKHAECLISADQKESFQIERDTLYTDSMSKLKKAGGSVPPRTQANPLREPASKVRRRILRDGARANDLRDLAFRRIIVSIPAGKVSTYGRVAAAAGYPLYHRAVARLLRTDPPDYLPWHRVLGAGGEIKLRHDAATEQRARLEMEGVRFRGKRVDMERFEYAARSWEVPD